MRLRSSGIRAMFAKLLSTFDYLSLSAGGFNLLAGRFGEAMSADGERVFEFAIAKDFDAIMDVVGEKTVGLEGSDINGGSGGEGIELGEVQDVEVLAEGVDKTAFGEAALKGHLAAFKARMGSGAGAGFLAFVTEASGFSEAGTGTTADAFGFFDGAFGGSKAGESVVSHG